MQRLSTVLERRSSCFPADQLGNLLREGDVLLFRGRRAADCLIRCCTRSEYNHVAIVTRFCGELQLLEATALGVGRCPLEF